MTRIIAALATMAAWFGTAQAIYVAPAFPNLPAFDSPIDIVDPLDGTDRLFVTERDGRIYVFQNDVNAFQRLLFLDIRDSVTTQTEGGLLGLAFHPNYESNRYFYAVYVNEGPRRTILARFTTFSGNPAAADPASELRILEMPQNFLHHKGGCVAFGPDGYLYLSLGDDGNSANSQNLSTLKGKVLRIDVDNPSGGNNYGIPPDNPFEGSPNGEREEIYASGFRNPWRFSFDFPTGRLWLGDVGQNTWEEVDLVLKGRNYGWPRMEGNACYSPSSCDTTGLNLVLPLQVYEHDGSASITGGCVYRGTAVPSLAGKYIYADYITGQVWALAYNGVDPPANQELAITSPGSIPAFGIDRDGEVFFSSFGGEIYRFFDFPTGANPPVLPVASLSAFPNPFTSHVSLEYTIGAPGRVTLEVFDVQGRRVKTWSRRAYEAGTHAVDWNGRDGADRPSPGGVYFARLSVDGRAAKSVKIVRFR